MLISSSQEKRMYASFLAISRACSYWKSMTLASEREQMIPKCHETQCMFDCWRLAWDVRGGWSNQARWEKARHVSRSQSSQKILAPQQIVAPKMAPSWLVRTFSLLLWIPWRFYTCLLSTSLVVWFIIEHWIQKLPKSALTNGFELDRPSIPFTRLLLKLRR